jgi:ribosome biogenesis GTPase
MAANVDTVFIFTSLDDDFNVRRIERYLAMVYEMGARPVVVLNKLDLCDDPGVYLNALKRSAPDVPVAAISALEGDNVDGLGEYIRPGETVVMVGSSGVGKSTLINHLLGYDRQRTGGVRGSDSKGRHVTTSRELVVLPGGGMLIDNPGIRELALWTDGEGISAAFEDIGELAGGCRFKDCLHMNEPRCAVKRAVEEGILSQGRLDNYHKLLREMEHARTKRDPQAARKKGKEFAKMMGYVEYKRKRQR